MNYATQSRARGRHRSAFHTIDAQSANCRRAALFTVALACTALTAILGGRAEASGHAEAPLIAQDPLADVTDVFAFIGTKVDEPAVKVLNVIVNVKPYCDPGAGSIYDRFTNDALYSIHICNPTSGREARRYDFKFSDVNPTGSPGLKNDDTILSYGLGTELGAIVDVGDARQNFTQTYTVRRLNGIIPTVIGDGLSTPPPNVGPRVTPLYNDANTGNAISGATTFNELDKYTQQTIHSLASGEVVFAGQRDDAFYADIPGFFDLLDPRVQDNDMDPGDGFGQDGGGVDGFKGYNVLTYAIQIPVDSLTSYSYTAPIDGPSNGVGVFASVSRPRLLVRRPHGVPASLGRFVQVSRMGNPLFNQLFVALKDKDNYNLTSPSRGRLRVRHVRAQPRTRLTLQPGIQYQLCRARTHGFGATVHSGPPPRRHHHIAGPIAGTVGIQPAWLYRQ